MLQSEVKKASEINKIEKELNKPITVKADVEVAHNYSTQSLNTTELAKEKLRQMLAKVQSSYQWRECQSLLSASFFDSIYNLFAFTPSLQ